MRVTGAVTLSSLLLGSAVAVGCTMDFDQYTPQGLPCGDGVLDRSLGEECDDGNRLDADACSAQCRLTAFTVKSDIGPQDQSQTLRPSVGLLGTSDDAPEFLLAWVSSPDQTEGRVETQRYQPNGTPVADGALTLSSEPTDVECTAIASTLEGRAVVAWNAVLASNVRETRWAVIEPDGAPWDLEPQAVTGTGPALFMGCPEVAAAATGELCILWHSAALEATLECLDASGQPPGVPVVLGAAGDFPTARVNGARAIWAAGEGFVAAWYDQATGALVARGVDATASTLSAVVVVDEQEPVYVGNGFGWGGADAFVASFGVGYETSGTTKYRYMVRGYDNLDEPAGEAILVSETHENEAGGRLVGSPSGRFLAVWPSSGGSAGCRLQGRLFDADGSPFGAAFPIGDLAEGECAEGVEGIANGAGDVMLAWTVEPESGTGAQATLRAAIYPGLLAP